MPVITRLCLLLMPKQLESHLTTIYIRNISSVASKVHWRIPRRNQYLNPQNLEKFLHAFVSSRKDYCDGIFIGLRSCQTKKLQSLTKFGAARLITHSRKYVHIHPTQLEPLYIYLVKAIQALARYSYRPV